MEQLQRGRVRRAKRRRLLKRRQMGRQWNVLQRRRWVSKKAIFPIERKEKPHAHPATSWPVLVIFCLCKSLGDGRNKETEDGGERQVHGSRSWSDGLEPFLSSSLFGQSDLVEFVLLCIFSFCSRPCPYERFVHTEACNILTHFFPPPPFLKNFFSMMLFIGVGPC